GECGIVSVADLEPQTRWKELTSTVSGLVPSGDGEGQWRASDWLSANEQRRMSKFTQYAIAASDMALKDAGWEPKSEEQLEATGLQKGITTIRTQNFDQYGGWSHSHEIWFPRPQPCSNYSLHNRCAFNWRCITLHQHGRRRYHGCRRLRIVHSSLDICRLRQSKILIDSIQQQSHSELPPI
ncbi:unnamed protein product, partial [Fusarium graminearum]